MCRKDSTKRGQHYADDEFVCHLLSLFVWNFYPFLVSNITMCLKSISFHCVQGKVMRSICISVGLKQDLQVMLGIVMMKGIVCELIRDLVTFLFSCNWALWTVMLHFIWYLSWSIILHKFLYFTWQTTKICTNCGK